MQPSTTDGAGDAIVLATGIHKSYETGRVRVDALRGVDVEYAVTARSLLVAYAIGVLLTLAVVAFSAWRVSRMTVASAIRNLPEPPPARRRRRVLGALAAIVLGALLTASGLSAGQATPLLLGISLVLVSLVPLLRLAGVPDRVAFTGAGLAVLVLWMVPWSWLEVVFGPLAMDFSTWVVAGLLVIVGAVWIIMFNAQLLLNAVARVLGRSRRLAPILRTSMAYPLAARFRSGITLDRPPRHAHDRWCAIRLRAARHGRALDLPADARQRLPRPRTADRPHVDLKPGVDADAAAARLESAFLASGMEAESIKSVMEDAVGASLTFNRLIQGFMALGLIVGVAALGVISARAVVERRQQIGVMRASSRAGRTSRSTCLGRARNHLRRGPGGRAARDARPRGPRLAHPPGRGAALRVSLRARLGRCAFRTTRAGTPTAAAPTVERPTATGRGADARRVASAVASAG